MKPYTTCSIAQMPAQMPQPMQRWSSETYSNAIFEVAEIVLRPLAMRPSHSCVCMKIQINGLDMP